jgi:hypothetical protein
MTVQVTVFALIWCAFVVIATYAAIGMFVALAPADLCGPGLSCSKGPSPAVLFASHAVIALVSFAGAAFGFLTVHSMRRARLEAMQAALDKEMARAHEEDLRTAELAGHPASSNLVHA